MFGREIRKKKFSGLCKSRRTKAFTAVCRRNDLARKIQRKAYADCFSISHLRFSSVKKGEQCPRPTAFKALEVLMFTISKLVCGKCGKVFV